MDMQKVIFLWGLWFLLLPQPAWPQLSAVSLDKTMAVLRTLPGMSVAEIQAAKNEVRRLDFLRNKVLQQLCRLPGVNGGQISTLLELAGRTTIRFEHLALLERFVALPGAELTGCRRLLTMIGETDFLQAQALVPMAGVEVRDSGQFLSLVEKTLGLSETGLWAAKELYGQVQLTGEIGLRAIGSLAAMGEEQQRTAEKYLSRQGLDHNRILPDLNAIAVLIGGPVINFRAICTIEEILPRDLSRWLHNFFLLPLPEREAEAKMLDQGRRRLLLEAYHRAAETIIWRINNLHSVTDRFGHELGTATLTRMTREELMAELSRLPEAVRGTYGAAFSQALSEGQRAAAIAELRAATAAARRFTATELTSANLYLLLAGGGELYTSSFREIVAPILRDRIRQNYQGQLLDFLQLNDPDKKYVAECITNMAQKGVLVSFLPKNGAAQSRIVDLVADSALADENSLILFSATFGNLLQTFADFVRDRLVDRLLEAAVDGDQPSFRQVRVILQHYFHTFPQLLSTDAREKIRVLLATLGEVDLRQYSLTPFARWREDHRLASISTFAGDDDGWTSYVSCSQDLLANGYVPTVSARYRLTAGDSRVEAEFARIVGAVRKSPTASLAALFALALQQPLVVEWQKSVGTMTISHGLYVFFDADHQQRLLEIFLREGDEMFAQRGHSYYRNSQLLSPLQTLLREGKISKELLAATPRFVSLGSCGGIKAYSRINAIFENNVDIFGTVGTGTARMNNSFNRRLLEIAALPEAPSSWQHVASLLEDISGKGQTGGEYIIPGSLPAILHKMHERSGFSFQDDVTDSF